MFIPPCQLATESPSILKHMISYLVYYLEYSLTAHAPTVRQVCPVSMKSALYFRKVEIEVPFVSHAYIDPHTNLSSLLYENK